MRRIPVLLLLIACGFLLPAEGRCKLEVPYEVRFQGVEGDLLERLRTVSDSYARRKSPPPTRFLLLKRAREDLPRLEETLRARAYYGAEVDVEIGEADEEPVEVTFRITPGPRYTLQGVELRCKPPKQCQERVRTMLPAPKELGLETDEPALAQEMRRAGERLRRLLHRRGYVFAQTDRPVVRVDHSAAAVILVLPFSPGPMARFGSTEIEGLETVSERFVRDKIPWGVGQTYDPAVVDRLENRLMETKLFSVIRVSHAESLNPSGLLPMTVTVRESYHRSIGVGAGYDTDTSLSGQASWEHRNLLGEGQHLRFRSFLSRFRQELEGTFRLPRFLREDQSLGLKGSLVREDTEAYTSLAYTGSVDVQREITPQVTAGSGFAYKGSRLDDAEGSNYFQLFSLPSFLEWDSRNNLLDPTRGVQSMLQLTPYKGVIAQDVAFFKSTLLAKWYRALTEDERFVLALRGKIGSLAGESTTDLPADERFYAGGGGSVRGYPYQEIGPRTEEDELLGGRSLAEVSAEIRWRWTERLGCAFFLDGGNAFDQELPDPDGKLFWGAGWGLRYFTGIGPLRLDVAFPLTQEEEFSQSFQIYVSIGQAF
jgi:translocation and assembly module TamA